MFMYGIARLIETLTKKKQKTKNVYLKLWVHKLIVCRKTGGEKGFITVIVTRCIFFQGDVFSSIDALYSFIYGKI